MYEAPATSHVVATFSYRSRPLLAGCLFVLATTGMILLGWVALTAAHPVNIRGVQLGPKQVRMLAGVAAVLAPVGLIPLASMLWNSIFGRSKITLTADSLIVPRWKGFRFKPEEAEIPFTSIHAVEVQRLSAGSWIIRVVHHDGVDALLSMLFDSWSSFNTLAGILTASPDDHLTKSKKLSTNVATLIHSAASAITSTA